MDTILRKIRDNKIDYDGVLSSSVISMPYDDMDGYDFHVIIPVRGRLRFVNPLLDSIYKARGKYNVAVTIVEHSGKREHGGGLKRRGVGFVYIKDDGVFNKCLAFNVGAILGPTSKWVVCHDVDCLVQSNFFKGIAENLKNKNTECVQSFNKRSPIYCNKELTDDILRGEADVENISVHTDGAFRGNGEAPGGSITVSRDLFFKVGGYDPELFTGYSPEDKFFWEKVSLYVNIGMCDDPPVDVFHLNHKGMMCTNPQINDVINTMRAFESINKDRMIHIVKLKEQLISEYA